MGSRTDLDKPRNRERDQLQKSSGGKGLTRGRGLTRKHSLNVPGEDAVEDRVHVHKANGGPQAEIILLQRTGDQVPPLDPDSLLFKQCKVFAAKAKGHWGQEALHRSGGLLTCQAAATDQDKEASKTSEGSYGEDFGPEANVVLPSHTEHIGQVEGEIDNPTTGCSQVCSGKCSAEQEALHDGHHCVGAKKEEDHPGVTVGQ